MDIKCLHGIRTTLHLTEKYKEYRLDSSEREQEREAASYEYGNEPLGSIKF
jgi:hypothetical protein